MQSALVFVVYLFGVSAGRYQRLDDGQVTSDARRMKRSGSTRPVCVHPGPVAKKKPDNIQPAPEGGEAERVDTILFLDRQF